MALSDKTRKMMLAHVGEEPDSKMSDDDLCDAHAKVAEKMAGMKKKATALSSFYYPDDANAVADPVEYIDKAIATLSAQNDSLTAERDENARLLTEANAAKATLAASATPRTADPAMVAVVKDSADLVREQCVSLGVINQGTADAIDSLLFEGDNATATFALSASPASGNRPRRTAFWRTVLAAGPVVPGGSGQKSAVTQVPGVPEHNPIAKVAASAGQPGAQPPVTDARIREMLATVSLTPIADAK